jgi:hypothetical protein
MRNQLKTITANLIASFSRSLGSNTARFVRDDSRPSMMRCDLDGLYFHLYGPSRQNTDYILDTFPISREREVSERDEDRIKRLILEIYDVHAEQTGVPYGTRPNPPAADPGLAHACQSEVR